MSLQTLQAALKEVVAQNRTAIAVFAAPLALVFSQLGKITALDSTLVTLLVSVSVVALFVGVALSIGFLQVVEVLLIRLALEQEGIPEDQSEPGSKYHKYLVGEYSGGHISFTEESLIERARTLTTPYYLCAILGYLPLFVVIFVILWF